ncbi:MAG: hypothetical protein RR708_04735 [Bacilli bacterium]
MRNYYIYETINNINNKKYIGQRTFSKDIKTDKYLGSGTNLKRALKFPTPAIIFQKGILEVCSQYNIDEREIHWISFYNSVKRSDYYNILPGGKNLGSEKNHPHYGKRGKDSPNYGKVNGKNNGMPRKCKIIFDGDVIIKDSKSEMIKYFRENYGISVVSWFKTMYDVPKNIKIEFNIMDIVNKNLNKVCTSNKKYDIINI